MQGQAHNIEDLGALNVNRAGLGDDLINEFYNWRKRAFKAEGNPYFKKWGSEKKKGGAKQRKAAAASGASFGGADAAAKSDTRVWMGSSFSEQDTAAGAEKSGDAAATAAAAAAAAAAAVNAPPGQQGLSYPSHVIRDDGEVGAELGLFGVESSPEGTWGLKKSYIQETPAATQPPINARGFRSKLALLRLGERGVEVGGPALTTAAVGYLAFGLGGDGAGEARAVELMGSLFGS